MKKLDEIDTKANRAVVERNEGSIHYIAPAIVSPEDLLSLTGALRDLLAYAADENEQHGHECSFVTTYDGKSLPCDCYKAVIPQTIARRIGGTVEFSGGNVVEVI